jgi:L-seryl-tRNA(Ser) seleniumtransferase
VPAPDPAELARRARRLAEAIAAAAGMRAEVVRTTAEAGSGSLPACEMESRAVRLVPDGGSAEALAAALRTGEPPVVARIHRGAVLLDVRTLSDGGGAGGPGGEQDEIAAIARRLAELAAVRPPAG